ncbi:hypothetical protein [Ramlibacter sp. Leaf400]|uniref:hypothetical protein n=1 Tax=Ramlibacter sp. Leaf400 TaxID=1736365 RepID=UPI0006FC2EA3|nr:hypothetical protein [Ramlibacter sp. Leaf400]KQT10989.1 hypothetical protein ASG30_09330 [Ramlibacter sp. Leaf400]
MNDPVDIIKVGASVLAQQLFLSALLRQQQGNAALIRDVEQTLATTKEAMAGPDGDPFREDFNRTVSQLLAVLRGV